MNIHEYQGKALLKAHGVPVLEGVHCTTVDQALAAYDQLGSKVVAVKSQIHAGGRGKGNLHHPETGELVMEGGVNTAGNLLVVNEQGAIASPSIPHEGLEILAEVLAVDVASTTVAGQDVVGSLAVANDQGVLLHPDVTPDEAMLIEEVLGVKPMVGTVSFGSPYVGAGVCASNTGAISGTQTTGPELNRIEDALGFL